jgi:hypothetical protein
LSDPLRQGKSAVKFLKTKPLITMNHTFRLVWNKSLGMLVAVSDCARSKGKGGSGETSAASLDINKINSSNRSVMLYGDGVKNKFPLKNSYTFAMLVSGIPEQVIWALTSTKGFLANMKKLQATLDNQRGEPSRLGFLSMTNKVIPTSAASLLILAVSSGISTKSLADTVGFSGDFAPVNWAFTITPGSTGTIDTTNAPTSIKLTGSDGASSTSKLTNYRIAAPANGTVSFSWSFVNRDIGGNGYDNPKFYNNGALTGR